MTKPCSDSGVVAVSPAAEVQPHPWRGHSGKGHSVVSSTSGVAVSDSSWWQSGQRQGALLSPHRSEWSWLAVLRKLSVVLAAQALMRPPGSILSSVKGQSVLAEGHVPTLSR